MVTIGTFFAFALAKTDSQPSELSGATTRSWTPESIICSTSLICLANCDVAFVVVRLVMPSVAASSLMDFVSAMRNGLASFSDWEKPTLAVLRSTFWYPIWSREQVGPLGAPDCTTCWPPALGAVVPPGLSSDLAQAPSSRTAAPAGATADVQRPRVALIMELLVAMMCGDIDE